MRNKPLIIFCFVANLFAIQAFAQNNETDNPQHTAGSIHLVLPSLEGEAKYNAFVQLQNAYAHTGDAKAQLAGAEEWIQYAHNHKNAEEEGKAREARSGVYGNNFLDMESPYYENDMAFWRKHEQWDRYFYGCIGYLQVIIVKGHREEALIEAQKQYDFAKSIT
jgi:hypothetical protein